MKVTIDSEHIVVIYSALRDYIEQYLELLDKSPDSKYYIEQIIKTRKAIKAIIEAKRSTDDEKN